MNIKLQRWQPDVTVAAICKQNDRYLLVEERSKSTGDIVFNQPAGHLESGESIVEAVIREVLEETCRHFTPKHLVGLYRLALSDQKTYLRYTFFGDVGEIDTSVERDIDIIDTHWLSRVEIEEHSALRSNLVAECITDFENGSLYPLDFLKDTTPK
jgi:ADP-ribose pyrophosphatase YjhB (NUDIX family)